MTRKLSQFKFAAACAGALAFGAHAADNATATATAVVVEPIAVTTASNMVFGNLVPGNGDVTLSTTAQRTRSGATAFSTTGSTPTAAQFNVTGSGSNTFAITYTGSSTALTGTGATPPTMAIDWITEAVAGTGAATGKTDATTDATTGTLSAGAARIYAGAKLTVGASQAADTYTGSLKVTVAYN